MFIDAGAFDVAIFESELLDRLIVQELDFVLRRYAKVVAIHNGPAESETLNKSSPSSAVDHRVNAIPLVQANVNDVFVDE